MKLNSQDKMDFISIDASSSLDLDDAFQLTKENDGYKLNIAISDVGMLVEKNSEVYKKALERGFTRYLSQKNINMIPKLLSENKLSLLENQKRSALIIAIPVDNDLNIGKPTLKFDYIINTRKLSYEETDSILCNDGNFILKIAYSISEKLFAERRKAGALVFFNKKTGLSTNEDGQIVRLKKENRFNSHILIQEFMILANRLIAAYFAENNLPGLFRNHTARQACPNREELLHDLDSTLDSGDFQKIELLQKRLNLILNRAEYNTVLTGHFGLNLAAYTHITSPIRRFPDLVNIIQLKAHLSENELPYSIDQLSSIAQKINSIESNMKKQKSNYFKIKDRKNTLEKIKNNSIQNLDPRDFFRMLKIASERNYLSNEIEQQINKRLDSNKILARDIFVLLFGNSSQKQEWVNIRVKLVNWIAAHPNLAISVLMMTHQLLNWQKAKFETKEYSSSPYKIFSSSGSIIIDNKIVNSDHHKATSKKNAEQIAASDLIAKILQIDFPGSKDEIDKMLSEDFEKVTANFKGKLLERCQKNKWILPEFKTQSKTEFQIPKFESQADIQIDGKLYSSEITVGRNVKQAEQLAAKDLLAKISGIGDQISNKNEIEVKNGNFIGALYEFMQIRKLPPPSFSFETTDDETICRINLILPDGTPKSFFGKGRNKKDAKLMAAKSSFLECCEI